MILRKYFLHIWRAICSLQVIFSAPPFKDCFASMKKADLHWGWTNVHTADRKCLGNVNSTFTAMICPLGTCLIFSTTPYAPRPSSMIGSRSSAFTSKFCRREKECNKTEKNKLDSRLPCPLSGFSQHSKGYFWSRSFFKQPLKVRSIGRCLDSQSMSLACHR